MMVFLVTLVLIWALQMLGSKANLGVIFGAPSYWSYADCGDWSFQYL